MKLEFRPARLADHLASPEICAAAQRASARELLLRLGIKLQPTKADLQNGCVRLWECAHDSQILGRCAADMRSGEIILLDVQRGYEGLGIGSRLLAIGVACLQEAGRQRIWLVAPADPTLRAWGFYRALGWRPTGESIDAANEVLELAATAASEGG